MKNVDAVVTQIRASALALSNLADALEGKEVKNDEAKQKKVNEISKPKEAEETK